MTITAQDVYFGLGKDLPCSACGALAAWRRVDGFKIRSNSFLNRFRCNACGEQIAVKLARSADRDSGDAIRREYEALRKLQGVFSPEDRLAALTPLACFEVVGHTALVTRWFEGKNAIHYGATAGSAELAAVYRSTGLLLRKLHDAFALDDRTRPLDAESKVAYLLDRYAVRLHTHQAGTRALGLLRDTIPQVATSELGWSWTHGDFKPENILCDGHRVVVLDTQLNVRGAIVYDIAPFLNHMLLASRTLGNRAIQTKYALLEQEFLAGYGGLDKGEMAALRWAQLYFMLCYLGRYRSGGIIASAYAQYKVGPLIKPLCTGLQEALVDWI